ncbi:hypothetical protein U9M48_000400, partial [Paspalum notatum var. saurae]
KKKKKKKKRTAHALDSPHPIGKLAHFWASGRLRPGTGASRISSLLAAPPSPAGPRPPAGLLFFTPSAPTRPPPGSSRAGSSKPSSGPPSSLRVYQKRHGGRQGLRVDGARAQSLICSSER